MLFSTYMRTYLHTFDDEQAENPDYWKDQRETVVRPNAEGEDMYWPRNTLVLTYTNIYGYLLAYDTDSGKCDGFLMTRPMGLR